MVDAFVSSMGVPQAPLKNVQLPGVQKIIGVSDEEADKVIAKVPF